MIKLTYPTNFMEFINYMYTKQIHMSSETQYKCEDCGMSFNSQQELQQHANKEHVGTA
jgi:transposase-like protein